MLPPVSTRTSESSATWATSSGATDGLSACVAPPDLGESRFSNAAKEELKPPGSVLNGSVGVFAALTGGHNSRRPRRSRGPGGGGREGTLCADASCAWLSKPAQ